MRILLVEPDFPYPNKSRNQANRIHRNFVPVGLLKLGALYRPKSTRLKLVRGNKSKKDIGFAPTDIFVTSLFTYWSKYVWEVVEHYRELFPRARITVGGIYATLHNKRKYFKDRLKEYGVDCHVGLHKEAEEVNPDYSLLMQDVDHHVTHAMRGCVRHCSFCGAWRIEPKRYDKPVDELIKEIQAVGKNRVIFFDNNFFAHSEIKRLLRELANVSVNQRPIIYESQSGFDGRFLQKNPEYAKLLKEANFKHVRIAWDSSFTKYHSIKDQLDILISAGYKPADIAIFMIYNYDTPYKEMMRKLGRCKEWGVQINDCRYRPLSTTYDNYDSRKHRTGQTAKDYYIHKEGGWSDSSIRDFRRNVRRHNIWIRYARRRGEEYNKDMERWSDIHNTFKFFGLDRPPEYGRIQSSPTWKQRVELMSKLKNYLKKHKMPKMSFRGVKRGMMNQMLIEACQMLGVQIG